MKTKDDFILLIKDNEKIIHKVIGLYVYHNEDKKDLYQEILLQAWKSFALFNGSSKFSTWLYKVSLNTVFSFIRKERPEEASDYEDMHRVVTPEDKKEEYGVLYDQVQQFNEVDRMLMMLHLDGYKNFEISEITGMNTNHVNVKIHRLKQTMVKQFNMATNGN